MHGHEKSDPAVVVVKPANKDGQPSAERVERRAGAEGNADQRDTHRAQNRASVTQALDRVRNGARQRNWPSVRFAVRHPRWEPYAGKPHVRFCAGGAQ